MTLLEYAEKISQAPLTAWQRTFLAMYEEAVSEGKQLICSFPPRNGQTMAKDIVNQYYHPEIKEVRCKVCNKLLAKLPPDVQYEIVCSKCKTINKQ